MAERAHRRCVADAVRTGTGTTTSNGRTALVTGASSGIGYATTGALARAGFTVYAGVRKESDAQRVQAIAHGVRPLMLDVTKPDELVAAVQRIRDDHATLQVVVVNAGIALGGPLEFFPLERLRHQLEINLVAALATAQATLPLLRETRGRLLFVGSISGRITPPFIGPYAASKAGLAALTDALRFELDSSGSGVSVSLFEFGSIKTPIWEKGKNSLERLDELSSPEQRRYYGYVPDAMRATLAHEERSGTDVDEIGRFIARVATAARPRERYLVGGGAKAGALAAALLPVRARGKVLRKAMGLP